MFRIQNIKKALALLLAICLITALMPSATFAQTTDTLTKGRIYQGFKLISQKMNPEIQSDTMIFEHVKTGAKLLFLKNDDDNKVFSIGFKTPASDNTGVNHIIEHSVLDGSANYPVKSPLNEMSKRSLNTFLNAFTASDRTVYPVASRNEKDFNNLMKVYLDAVLYPNVIKNEKIFMQEGWHYELDSKNSELQLNGVVYNEMKGYHSSSNEILRNKIRESLFPNTEYKWNSGGTPDGIPTLTWQKLKDTYHKYYHPSNAYIFLYGNVNIKKTLEFIDTKYLGKFSKKTMNVSTTRQKPFNKLNVVTAEYPIQKDASPKDKNIFALNFILDNTTNKDDVIACMFLDYLLLGNNGSPLKSALLAKGIGNNVYGSVSMDSMQATYSIIAENADASKQELFKKTIQDTLTDIVNKGLDKELTKSLLHSYEINLRADRSNANRGINYNMLALSTWMYNGDPNPYLTLNTTVEKLKKSVSGRYFENLITKYLLKSKNSSLVVLKPVPGLDEKKDSDLKTRLKKIKSQLSKKQLERLVRQTAEFKKWQSTPDSEKALAKLPTLDVTDLEKQAESIPLNIKDEKGVKVLYHPLYTNKLAYVDLYFDTSSVPQEKLPYLYLYSNLFGGLDTENHNFMQVLNQLINCVGSINCNPVTFTKYQDANTYYPKMNISFYTLDSDLQASLAILDEIINHTKYDNTALLQQYIKQVKSSLDMQLVGMGMKISRNRLHSYLSESGKYENIGDLPLYDFITDLDKNFSTKAEEIAKNLKEVAHLVFNKNNLSVGVTCEPEQYAAFQQHFHSFADKLSAADVKPQTYKFDNTVKNEGLITTAQVQYIAKGYDFTKLGYQYSGKMQVLKNILDGEYVWNRIREVGGAYGGSFSISNNGYAEFLSWQDPNIKESLDVFDQSGDFIKNFKISDKNIANYIISTIGGMDRPLSPSQRGKISDQNYFSGITQEDIQRERDEILSTTAKDINGYSDLLTKLTKQNYFCVFGSQAKITENRDIFDTTSNIMKN